MTLLAGATAGIVNPINPLLRARAYRRILRDTGAKVVVTLAPFPKTDVAQKVAEALALAPGVETVLQVDLRALPVAAARLDRAVHPAEARSRGTRRACSISPRKWRRERGGCARFRGRAGRPGLRLFPHRRHHRPAQGRAAPGERHALQRLVRQFYIFTETDVLMCPLPMFHVFAAYPILMSCLMSGAQMVMPTPQGYRGEGVIGQFLEAGRALAGHAS